MGITLQLPPEVVSRLREHATHHDVEAVRRVLSEEADVVADATIQALMPPHHADGLTAEEFDALTEELLALSDSDPPFPNSTFSRDDIYRDHP